VRVSKPCAPQKVLNRVMMSFQSNFPVLLLRVGGREEEVEEKIEKELLTAGKSGIGDGGREGGREGGKLMGRLTYLLTLRFIHCFSFMLNFLVTRLTVGSRSLKMLSFLGPRPACLPMRRLRFATMWHKGYAGRCMLCVRCVLVLCVRCAPNTLFLTR